MLVITAMNQNDDGVDLQQMRYVVAVAETRNFTRAAERCFVVQSSLSHRIAGLERELGVKLFARSSRRVELTPAGVAFVVATAGPISLRNVLSPVSQSSTYFRTLELGV